MAKKVFFIFIIVILAGLNTEIISGSTEETVGIETILVRPTKPPPPPQEKIWLEIEATAYSPPLFPEGQATKSGFPVGWGVIAVDRKVIPLGSIVFLEVENLSQELASPLPRFCRAIDTGRNIIGKRIDIWLPDFSLAKKFGRRTIKARILTSP